MVRRTKTMSSASIVNIISNAECALILRPLIEIGYLSG